MELTKQRALEITRDLWWWLAAHPVEHKSEWPSWRQNGGDVEDMVWDCPCCQTVKNSFPLEIANRVRPLMPCARDMGDEDEFRLLIGACPLQSVWPEGCCHKESPFQKWSDDKQPALNATRIAEAAEAELEKLLHPSLETREEKEI